MTEAELIDYYADLLIMQYKHKPRARAHVKVVVKMILMGNLPLQVQNAYDLETAVGKQLDVLGKFQNVKRTNYTFTKQVELGDGDFKTLIQIATIKNNGGSSLKDIDMLLTQFFGSQIRVYDYNNMRISYMIDSSVASTQLIEILIVQGLLPKPMGVTLSSTITFPYLNSFFGYSAYGDNGEQNQNNSPYNTYDDYRMDRPWVSYKYIVGRENVITSFITTEIVAQRLNQENNGHLIA